MSNPRAWFFSFAAAGLWLGVAVAALYVFLGAPASAEGAGVAVGRLLGAAMMAAGIVGWAARRSASTWPFWRYVVLVLVAMIVVHLLAVVGRHGT